LFLFCCNMIVLYLFCYNCQVLGDFLNAGLQFVSMSLHGCSNKKLDIISKI
jgi:hypothetical protein